MRMRGFARRLDAQGPALELWREGERRAAETLLAASAEARAPQGRAQVAAARRRDG